MEEEPVVFHSSSKYIFYIIITIIVGTTLIVDLSRFVMVALISDPLSWLAFSLFSLLAITILVTPVVWRMRHSLIYNEPIWNMRVREVAPSEYTHLMREYKQEYWHILSHFSIFYFSLAIVTGLLAISSPFILLSASPLFLQSSPVLYGVFIILFAMSIVHLLYGAIPTDASANFTVTPLRSINHGLRVLARSAAISWWGVRVKIGESHGFFILRDPVPIGRISGIENEAAILVYMKQGRPIIIQAELGWSGEQIAEPVSSEDNNETLRRVILKVINTYIQFSGDTDAVLDVLYDLGLKPGDDFMSKRSPS